ncbi:MAG: APC family permease [gamma proteobacterium endosymbiont of Lamellibrachia anaximandri]|nr:APC family permease [gamma proteobacterium endosymbiont of Lamellibrachia anaximandri]
MEHTIPELDKKGLREFGLVTGGIIAVIFGLFFPWLLDISIPLWPWVLAGILAVWALLAPNSLGPVYMVWMMFGLMMSKITTPLILGIIFFLVFFPAGLIMRLFNDPMRRKYDADAKSYRIDSHTPDKKSLENPY